MGLRNVACVHEASHALAVLRFCQHVATSKSSELRLTAGPEVGHLEISQVQSRATKGLVAAATERRTARIVKDFMMMVCGVAKS